MYFSIFNTNSILHKDNLRKIHLEYRVSFLTTESLDSFFNLNTAMSFEYTISRIQSLITRTKQVLTGEIESFVFPEEQIGPSVLVNSSTVKEWDDLESIPTPDFLAVLEVYLKEMEEFERTQKTKKELE